MFPLFGIASILFSCTKLQASCDLLLELAQNN
jgi:hypothetical protein